MSKQVFVANTILTASQLNTLQANDYNQTVATKTASYTLVASDAGTRVVMNVASANTVTVNTSLFTAGDTLVIQNIGAGVTTVTAGTATVSSAGSLAIQQYGSGTLYFTSAGVALFFPSAGPTASSGLTLIAAASAGATSSLTISNCFSATYNVYYFHAYQMTFSGSNVGLNMRYGTSGTPDTAASYTFGNARTDQASTGGNAGAANAAQASLGANYGRNANGGDSVNLIISAPFTADFTKAAGQNLGNWDTNDLYGYDHFSFKATTSSYTDLVLFPASGTIAVKYAIYGLAASQDIMTTPQTTIHDCATGETITRDYTTDELAQLEIDKAQAVKDAAAKAKADADKQAARQTVLDKLGLTADEVTALLG